jgi:hypothetical protein
MQSFAMPPLMLGPHRMVPGNTTTRQAALLLKAASTASGLTVIGTPLISTGMWPGAGRTITVMAASLSPTVKVSAVDSWL